VDNLWIVDNVWIRLWIIVHQLLTLETPQMA
jgi:hypothetical protein